MSSRKSGKGSKNIHKNGLQSPPALDQEDSYYLEMAAEHAAKTLFENNFGSIEEALGIGLTENDKLVKDKLFRDIVDNGIDEEDMYYLKKYFDMMQKERKYCIDCKIKKMTVSAMKTSRDTDNVPTIIKENIAGPNSSKYAIIGPKNREQTTVKPITTKPKPFDHNYFGARVSAFTSKDSVDSHSSPSENLYKPSVSEHSILKQVKPEYPNIPSTSSEYTTIIGPKHREETSAKQMPFDHNYCGTRVSTCSSEDSDDSSSSSSDDLYEPSVSEHSILKQVKPEYPNIPSTSSEYTTIIGPKHREETSAKPMSFDHNYCGTRVSTCTSEDSDDSSSSSSDDLYEPSVSEHSILKQVKPEYPNKPLTSSEYTTIIGPKHREETSAKPMPFDHNYYSTRVSASTSEDSVDSSSSSSDNLYEPSVSEHSILKQVKLEYPNIPSTNSEHTIIIGPKHREKTSAKPMPFDHDYCGTRVSACSSEDSIDSSSSSSDNLYEPSVSEHSILKQVKPEYPNIPSTNSEHTIIIGPKHREETTKKPMPFDHNYYSTRVSACTSEDSVNSSSSSSENLFELSESKQAKPEYPNITSSSRKEPTPRLSAIEETVARSKKLGRIFNTQSMFRDKDPSQIYQNVSDYLVSKDVTIETLKKPRKPAIKGKNTIPKSTTVKKSIKKSKTVEKSKTTCRYKDIKKSVQFKYISQTSDSEDGIQNPAVEPVAREKTNNRPTKLGISIIRSKTLDGIVCKPSTSKQTITGVTLGDTVVESTALEHHNQSSWDKGVRRQITSEFTNNSSNRETTIEINPGVDKLPESECGMESPWDWIIRKVENYKKYFARYDHIFNREACWFHQLTWIPHPTTSGKGLKCARTTPYVKIEKSLLNSANITNPAESDTEVSPIRKKRKWDQEYDYRLSPIITRISKVKNIYKKVESTEDSDDTYTDDESFNTLYNEEQQTITKDLLNDQIKKTKFCPAKSNLFTSDHVKFLKRRLKLGKSTIHGFGVFATENIKAREIIIEYVGEIIRPIIADIRESVYKHIFCFTIDDQTIVDASKRGNISRYINHSCRPNSFAKLLVYKNQKKIVIYAKRRIITGEEITYDYQMAPHDDKIPCSCNSKNCKKSIN